jgi:transposase
MTLTTPFDPQEQAARIRAQIKARPDLISAEHRTLALRAALAETSDTSEGVAVLQALVLQMDEEQAQLEQSVGRMSVLVANKEALIGKLIQAVKDLKTLKFGKRSEKMSPDQLALALEDVVVTADALQAQIDRIDAEAAVISGSSTPDQEKAARKRRETGEPRASLPPDLPVREEIIQPQSLVCPCCSGALHQIGETSSDRLGVIPVQYYIHRTIRPKYACRACEGQVAQAPAPAHVVEGGLPTEALIAQMLVAKHADHTPIYTQVAAMARQGVVVGRNVAAGWCGRGAGELRPIWSRMLEHMLADHYIYMDETTAPVLDPGRGRTFTGFFWAIARDGRPYGGKDPPMVIHVYAPGRGAEHPRKILQAFTGVIQCDGYKAYKSLAKDRTDITLAFCWAHSRRKFFKLIKADGSAPLAAEAVRQIGAFYAIEAQIRGQTPDERRSARQIHTAPLLEDFHRWLVDAAAKTMKGSTIREAVSYALDHWEGLNRFVDDGKIEIDSNAVERSIRGVCLTRKNSLFAGSPGGAENWAIVASIIETCKLNGVDTQAYLTDVLTRIVNGHPNKRIDELMPWRWAPLNHPAKAAA